MELNAKNTKRIILIVSVAILLYLCLNNLGVIWAIISKLFSLAAPVIAGLCIAFVLNIPMSALEKKVFFFIGKAKKPWIRKFMRPLSMLTTFALAIGAVVLLLYFILPELAGTIMTITDNLSDYISSLINWINNILAGINPNWQIEPQGDIDWAGMLKSVFTLLFSAENSSVIIDTATGVTSTVFGSVTDVVFSVIMACYVLAQKEKIGRFVKNMMENLLPDKLVRKILSVCSLANRSFASFVSGQFLEALILGGLCFVGMLIFGFDYALMISLVIAVTALVPIVGAFIGVIIGGLLILTESPSEALLFVVYILVLQQIEGNLIYPRVVGKSVGLPGVLVFSAVIIGTNINGFVGALLAVPLCAMLYALLKEEMKNKKLKGKLQAGESFFKEEETEELKPTAVQANTVKVQNKPANNSRKKKK